MAIYDKHFYHGSLKKYKKMFTALFSGLDVVRYDDQGKEIDRTRVPISYSNKQKWIQRLIQDPKLERQPSITLPRMAFEMTGFQYDSSRKISNKRQLCLVQESEDPNATPVIGVPTPWNITFSLYLTAKHEEDLDQLVEQIIPWFTPDYTFRIKGVTNPAFAFDIPLSLMDVQTTDSYEGAFEDGRTIIRTMTFMMKTQVFGPQRGTDANLIKHIDLNFRGTDGSFISDIEIEPFIEGIPLSDIKATDDYEIITKRTP